MAKKKDTPTQQAAQIGQKKLRQLLKDAGAAYKDGREIAGGIGQKIANAIEHDHLHKKAFATIRALDRMTPEKLADYMDTLLYYYEISGLEERAKSAPRLSLDAGAAEEDGEEEGAGGDDKVHRLHAAE